VAATTSNAENAAGGATYTVMVRVVSDANCHNSGWLMTNFIDTNIINKSLGLKAKLNAIFLSQFVLFVNY